MSDNTKAQNPAASPRIPVDVWAVALALLLVALVKLGWLTAIGW
jgi:hypothetical protein